VRKTPRWYDDEVERHAGLILSEGETQEQALVSLRMLVRDDHREFGNAILDDYSAPKLATAMAALRSRRAAELRAELTKARAEAQAEAEKPIAPLRAAPPSAPLQATPRPAPAAAQPAPPVRSHAPAQDHPAPVSVPRIEENPPPQDERIASMQRELATLEPPSDPEWDLHRTMFPDFPFRSLRVTPERYEEVHKMTRHQLEAAKGMLWAKTGNSIKGARTERRQFRAVFDKVHPLMQGDDTVADVERRLAAELHPVRGNLPPLPVRDTKGCEGACTFTSLHTMLRAWETPRKTPSTTTPEPWPGPAGRPASPRRTWPASSACP
jgi:hypothetical protein